MEMSEGKMGISKTMFIIGLIVAILASSLISVMTSMQWALIKGPKGDKGDKGDTGATGPAGPQGEQGSAQAGVRLFKLNVNFYTQNSTKKIDIDVGNSGTSDTQIIILYTGTSSTTLQNQTTTPTLPAALRAGSTQRITINYDWTGGVTYYFKVVSSAGQALEWPEQAPSMGTEQLTISKITWTWSGTATLRTFTINVNNTGTKDLTINQILVNYGTSGVTQPASLPKILKASESAVLTVTYAYTNGTNYDISVATASNYKFTNTFVGGQDTG